MLDEETTAILGLAAGQDRGWEAITLEN